MHIPITNMELEIIISPQVFESIEVVVLVLSGLVAPLAERAILDLGGVDLIVIDKIK